MSNMFLFFSKISKLFPIFLLFYFFILLYNKSTKVHIAEHNFIMRTTILFVRNVCCCADSGMTAHCASKYLLYSIFCARKLIQRRILYGSQI